MAENAINGGKDANPYFQREDGRGHQPHNKLCCYDLNETNYLSKHWYSDDSMNKKGEVKRETYYGICGIGPKDTTGSSGSGPYNKSYYSWYSGSSAGKNGNLTMLCNMGGDDGVTQFSSCDFNVLTGESPQPE